MNPNFGATSADYAKHRAGFPDSFFERIAALGLAKPGQDVVDFGTGTGTLARGFARRGCRVVGLDIAEPQLEQARALAAAEGLTIDFRARPAEKTELLDGCADLVTAGQCWHWFDGARAAREVTRLLRRDSTLVIAHFDWIPLDGNVVRATEELIEAHNPTWKLGNGFGLHPW
jgi:SAM-dependent methyltransferase